MQYSLRTLFILMAAICVYLGILNAPIFISFPVFCTLALLAPAYWVTGVVYARGEQRAFFIGGLAAGAAPFVAMVFTSLVMLIDGPFRWGRGFGRYEWGETQFFNMVSSLLIFAPIAIAFLGGWIALALYRRLQPAQDGARSDGVSTT
jgi:hypothetical protein